MLVVLLLVLLLCSVVGNLLLANHHFHSSRDRAWQARQEARQADEDFHRLEVALARLCKKVAAFEDDLYELLEGD